NDTTGVGRDFHVRQTSANLTMAPREGKRFSVSLDYLNSVTDSRIAILVPPFFTPDTSIYAFDSHSAGAWVDLNLFRGARLNFGGSLMLSDGTRPTRFYQPRALLSV